jgi:hypothetical protein
MHGETVKISYYSIHMTNREKTFESGGNDFLRASLIEWYDADPQRRVATLDFVIWTETRQREAPMLTADSQM